MQLLIIAFLCLLLGTMGVGLWQQVELFEMNARSFCQLQQNNLLLEHLFSYAIAYLVNDARITAFALEEETFTFRPWPADDESHFGTLYIKRVEASYVIKVCLYENEILRGIKTGRLVYEAAFNSFKLVRDSPLKRE